MLFLQVRSHILAEDHSPSLSQTNKLKIRLQFYLQLLTCMCECANFCLLICECPADADESVCMDVVICNKIYMTYICGSVSRAHLHITVSGALHRVQLVQAGVGRRIGCLIFIGHFPQRSPIISGSFCPKGAFRRNMTCKL